MVKYPFNQNQPIDMSKYWMNDPYWGSYMTQEGYDMFMKNLEGKNINPMVRKILEGVLKENVKKGTYAQTEQEAKYTEEEMKRDLAKITRDISTQTQQGVNLAEEASAADPNAPKEVTEARKRGVAQKGQEAIAGVESDLLQYKDQRDFAAQQFITQMRMNYEQLQLQKEQLKMQQEAQQENQKWAQLGFLSNAVSMFVPMAGPAMNFLGNLFKQGTTQPNATPYPSFNTVAPPAQVSAYNPATQSTYQQQTARSGWSNPYEMAPNSVAEGYGRRNNYNWNW